MTVDVLGAKVKVYEEIAQLLNAVNCDAVEVQKYCESKQKHLMQQLPRVTTTQACGIIEQALCERARLGRPTAGSRSGMDAIEIILFVMLCVTMSVFVLKVLSDLSR